MEEADCCHFITEVAEFNQGLFKGAPPEVAE
jgi:hypothetical protein